MKNYFFTKDIYIIILLSCVLINSCNKNSIGDCVKRAGEIDTIEMELDFFYGIEVFNKLNVYLKQDTINKILIVGNKNLISSVSYNILDSILMLQEFNICNFTRNPDNKIDVTVFTTNLEQVFISGPSDVTSIDTLKFKRIVFRVYGDVSKVDVEVECSHFFMEHWLCTGDSYIAGKADFFHILNDGNSYIHAFDLTCNYAHVSQESTGDIEISVEKKITSRIIDIGNIYYKGEPEIEITEQTNTGEIIHVN